MLKRLRRKFIAYVMVLVGTVLVGVLGTTYLATVEAHERMVESSLARSLSNGLDVRPVMGERRPVDDDGMGQMLGLLVEADGSGIVLDISDAPVVMDPSALRKVIAMVVSDGQLSGRDHDLHLAWEASYVSDGIWHVAIVDTTTSDAVIRQQAVKDVQIVCLALVALFVITWWLSGWALRPVEQAWEQQRRFVSDASHELKTPLAVILANTQILDRHEGVSEDARRWVTSTSEEAEHMKALVGDLLQLARADESAAGGAVSVMRHEDVDLSELVESAALEFDAVAFERGCMLETEVTEGIHVEGDPEWLERLTRILIDNACKYGAEGTTVTLTLTRVGSHPTLSVNNLGNPIDPEDLPHVFERFYRSDKARIREGEGGFGLGLAIAKGIADAHGGSIQVTSNEASGTTFRVTL